jgi:hypothetical protein
MDVHGTKASARPGANDHHATRQRVEELSFVAWPLNCKLRWQNFDRQEEKPCSRKIETRMTFEVSQEAPSGIGSTLASDHFSSGLELSSGHT